VLDVLVRALKPERVLEVGAAIGYSAIVIADALAPWGHLDTIEIDPTTAARAEANLREAGHGRRTVVHRGPALEVVAKLEARYDLVFIDAAKEEYERYLERALPLVPKGGVVLVDNLLWGGRAATGDRPGDEDWRRANTAAIRAFNERFLRHPDLRAQVLPVGDGLGIGVKV
jgi:predicted O-methyltransferase YrrM